MRAASITSLEKAFDPSIRAAAAPGLNRHDWESEFASLEDGLHDDPAGALPELDGLVARMLEEAGYDLEDPVAREGEEREVISEYTAAHEITRASEAGNDEISSGDVAS